jgi:hypothetical protein
MAALAAVAALAATGPAAAATPPSATTGAVTSIGSTTATITGTFNPNGTSTSWYFQYGTSTSYGTKTTTTSGGSGTSDTNVSASLTGLAPGTTYHYELVATSTGGTTEGGDGVFTTTSAPAPTVVTSAATSVTSTSATLNGTVNPNGRQTTWFFDYGTSTSYGSTTPSQNAGSGTSTVPVSITVTGLQPGQAYHFRLVGSSGSGTNRGNDFSFTTTAVGGGPTATTKAVSSVTSSSAKLNGSVKPNGLATTWYFQYGTSTSYGSQTPTENAGSGTGTTNVSATISGLGPGVYHFRLVATNAAGTSVGADESFGGSPPSVQTGTAQGAATTSVTLTGSVNPQGNSTNWYFQYGTTTNYGSKTSTKGVGSGTQTVGVSATLSNLASGTTYHYRLVGSNHHGTTFGSDVTFSTAVAVTISASTVQAVYGKRVTLAGIVSTRQQGVTVTILAQPYGSSGFSSIGTAVTGSGGAWSFQVKPKLQTAYEARLSNGTSTPTTIGVRPAVTLRIITKHRFTTRVVAPKSFFHKIVKLQVAIEGGRWKTVARAKLGRKSSAIFSEKRLPKGTSTVRVAMSINQAGTGYLGAFSRTITYHRH